jgi:hypothetical protein
MGMKIFGMVQEVGVLQPLEMQTQLQLFVKWWHEIISGLSEWWWMNKETVLQILHEELWKRKICTKFMPHRHMDEQQQQRHIMPRLHPDSSRHSQFSCLHFSLSWGENCPQSKRFQDVDDTEKNTTAELNGVPLEVFANCFQKLFKRFNKSIQVGRGDFE